MNKNNKIKLVSLIGFLVAPLLHAENRTEIEAEPEADSDKKVVVVGVPIVKDNIVDLFSSTSTLVSEQQIRDQNAIDLASALRTVPSVQISRFNPVGSFGGNEGGGVFIRGLGSSRPGSEIKTYIDGIPFYMGLWNHPLLDLLPLNGMQSITVHKAPQLHVNGNNFASINLTTKRAIEESVQINAKVTTGEFGTVTQQADVSGRSGNFDYMFAQGYATSDGHRDNAGGELFNVMGRLGYDISEHWNVGGFYLYTDNEANDPGEIGLPAPAIAPHYDTNAGLFALTLEHTHENSSGSLRLYSSSGDGDWLNQPALDGDTLTHFKMKGVRLNESLSLWQNGLVTLGVEHDEVSGKIHFNRIFPAPSDSFETPEFRLTSPHLSLSHEFFVNEEWSFIPSAGVRYYDHSNFDSETTVQSGFSFVSDMMTVFAHFSSGTNYPGLEVTTLSDLIPALGTSWQDLQVETLDHSEIGIKLKLETQTAIDFSIFENKISDRYVFGFPPHLPPPPQFINIGEYKTRGTELSLRQSISNHWALLAAVSLLDPDIEHLPYSPERSATFGLNGKWEEWRVSIDSQYQSEIWAMNQSRAAGNVNMQQVSAFTVVNSRLAYLLPSLGEKGEVFVAVENLLDREYSFRPGYPMPGRWLQLGISLSFEP